MASKPLDRGTLLSLYHGYLDCLNAQDWARLDEFVHPEVTHNARPLGLAGYQAMLEGDHRAIPDLHFRAETLVADPPAIAARLRFDCTPAGMLSDLPVNGRRVTFDEHVFYRVSDGRIREVHSLIDRDAIAAQI